MEFVVGLMLQELAIDEKNKIGQYVVRENKMVGAAASSPMQRKLRWEYGENEKEPANERRTLMR